jgi:hypothetical protein
MNYSSINRWIWLQNMDTAGRPREKVNPSRFESRKWSSMRSMDGRTATAVANGPKRYDACPQGESEIVVETMFSERGEKN